MKRVVVTSCSPLYFHRDNQVGWEDVWLRVFSRRRRLRLAPTLVSHTELLSDLTMQRRLAHKYAAIENGDEVDDRDEVRDLRLAFDAAANELYDIEQHLLDFPYYVDEYTRGRCNSYVPGDDPGRGYVFANIYTRAEWIDRAEAERMLDVYLGRVGIKRCVYKWKRPSIMVVPTTFTPEQVAAPAA